MNAAHLRELIALGITGEVLVRVAEIIDEASASVLGQSADKSADIRGGPLESTAEKERKVRDKQRKRAVRAAEKAEKMSASLSADSPRTRPEFPLTEEEKNRSFQGKIKKESKKGSRLLIGARATNEQKLIAIEIGCPPDRVDAVWNEFVDYWSDIPGQRGCKLTWTGTWRNWVKRIFGKANNGHAVSNHRTVSTTGRATSREADQIAAMGRGAANRLAMRAPAGPDNGETPGSAGSAEVFDIRKRAETAY